MKLGDVAEVVGGGTPDTKVTKYWDSKIPWLTPRDLSNFSGRYISKGERGISDLGLSKSSAKILPKGSVLLTTRDPVGYLAIADDDVSTNQGFRSLIPNQETDNLFLFYLLKKNVEYLKSQSDGTTFGELAGSTLKSLSFLFPPLPEQKAIAEVLSSLDDKIDLLHRQNKTLEEMAQTLFRQWFVEEADDGWGKTTIENVCSKINSGGTPSTNSSEYYGGNINWYSTKELTDRFLFESSTQITNEGLENSSAKIFPTNTIVMAIYAAPTVGRLGILTKEAAFNQAACGLIADENKICFEYLYLHFLLSRRVLCDMASSSAQQNLNVGIIKNFPIVLPPKNLMEVFRNQAKPIFTKIKNNSAQVYTIENLRDTLLPKLMSGIKRIEY